MTVSLVLLAAAVAVLGAFQAYLWRRLRAIQRRERETAARLRKLFADLGALCKASTGAGERLVAVEQQLRRLMERQDQMELRNGGEHAYGRAIQMVQNGAGAAELTRACGLTQGEAELIVMLHGLDKAG